MSMNYICITPYKELYQGKESIFDNLREGCSIPEKVIAYLRAGDAYCVCPGIYKHPFKEDTTLLGPYVYTDGIYCWDRDTWKYAVKYHLLLPEEFIAHVMSEEGSKFLDKQTGDRKNWTAVIKEWKKREDFLCFLPEDVGDMKLSDF